MEEGEAKGVRTRENLVDSPLDQYEAKNAIRYNLDRGSVTQNSEEGPRHISPRVLARTREDWLQRG